MSNGTNNPDRLYNLMPTLYRERDEREGFPLRDLLRIVGEQSEIVHSDIQLLWDNFFIETCERWAVPYIGDLVSNNLLNDAQNLDSPDTARSLFPDLTGPDLRPANAIRTRADVAKTIYYRRRKGTLPMLEELARDVTGWPAHAVEFFELLIWNQNLNHLRMHSTRCPDLRSPQSVDLLNRQFDFISHTVDVRYPRQDEGWYNIRNIGFFLWRLRAYAAENVLARQGAQLWQWYLSPLGNPAPLFSRSRREGNEAGLATEFHVPGPIRPAAFFDTPDQFYGQTSNDSIVIFRDGVAVPLSQIRCRDLSTWTQPAGNIVGVDVVRGRIAFGAAFVPAQQADVNYYYGFSADIGGGPYPRSKWLVDTDVPAVRLTVIEGGVAPDFPTLNGAIADWVLRGRPNTVISILDNRTHPLDSALTLEDNSFLIIQAADERRPHIQPDNGELEISGDHPGSQFTLSGLLFEGGVHVTGETQLLRILHSTLVPGRGLREDGTPVTNLPSIVVDGLNGAGEVINAAFDLRIASSITGPLRVPNHADSIVLLDSILDGIGEPAVAATGSVADPSAPGTLERVTILGRSAFRKIPLASEVIFTEQVIAEQRQEGCVRFSYVNHLSLTPRRYRCQPDLEIADEIEKAEKVGPPLTPAQRAAITSLARARIVPSFTSFHYGDPGYAQLHLNCPVEIRTGAEDGSEMGVFCHLKQPQRETNLRIRLEEYLPFGLDPGDNLCHLNQEAPMGGDYSRFRFKPQRHYSGIFEQQGRVDLDSDFNELIEIIDRRWRSETLDIVDHCVVPNTTPDAFLVTPTALGDFDIGIGRMYVDGIQAENHGRPPLEYNAILGELTGTTPIPYSDQPHLPAPLPPVLTAAPGTTDLVYIDVWYREVTVLEDPSLREIALGGPDTTTRIQTAWQVRVLQDVGQHDCGDDIAIWNETVAPSAGRLTTTAVAPPASDDPCILSPSGGYRGLENRLYRVEIHSTGAIGGGAPAKFKWSRNNSTIASSVSAIPSTTQITAQQVGRDQVLRFDIGNWIEITDDFREFQSLSGHMAQVTAIDEANRIITFAPPIPGAINFNPADASRHTRVRRWDETAGVDVNGLLDVVAGPIDIEDGIRVEFSLDPAAGGFKVGDYWVFAARTADGSVEILDAAPPRGILHHFCRLGFINWGTTVETTTFDDCRPHWPPGGGDECDCCTVTVGDGVDSHGQFTDIQQAINALGSRGGLVCIGRGFYQVNAGLILNNSKHNVIIRGVGPATRIFFAPAAGNAARVFLTIERTDHVRLEDFFGVSLNADAMVRIIESHFCRVERCTLVNVAVPSATGAVAPARGIDFIGDDSHCQIVNNALIASKAITSTSGQVRELEVRDNQILALQVSVLLNQAAGIEIVHNQMRGLPREGLVGTAPLTRATIDAFQTQVTNLLGATPAAANFQAAGVMLFTGNRVVITQNLITAQVGVLGFLFLNARIHQNDVVSLIGVLLIYGIRTKIEDNFVLGLFAGLVHAGIIVDMDCTSNEWLGLIGIMWMSLAELQKIFAGLLGTAVGSAGLAPSGPVAVSTAATTGTGLAGALTPIGIAVINKIHRNVFFSFSRGIFKSDAVISADISIVDNTFEFCRLVAIELGGGGRDTQLLAALVQRFNLRHLIESNAFSITGRGIISSSMFTHAVQNSIQCTNVGIELDAAFSTARNNSIFGLGAELAANDIGLVILYATATSASVSGNQLFNANGHGILIAEDLANATIEDNNVQLVRRFGIGTLSDTTGLRRTSISRNRVQTCLGTVDTDRVQFGGAIVIGEALDIRVIDNIVNGNTPLTPGDQFLRWFAIYAEDVDGAEVSGNAVTNNANLQGLGGSIGAIGLQGVRGMIRIQNNAVRNNGGTALAVGEGRQVAEQIQQVLAQNNHFASGPNPGFFLVWMNTIDSLLFQGNQCIGVTTATTPAPGAQPPVGLLATRANVSGNMVDIGGTIALDVVGVDLVVNANSVRFGLRVTGSPVAPGAVRVIVTSNLASSLTATSTGALLRVNNIPAP